jgi:ABC-type transport system substrate-binding protein
MHSWRREVIGLCDTEDWVVGRLDSRQLMGGRRKHVVARSTVHRVFVLVMVLAVVVSAFTLSGCGTPIPSAPEATSTPQVAPTAPPEEQPTATAPAGPEGEDRYGGTLYYSSGTVEERLYPPLMTSNTSCTRNTQVFGTLVSYVLGSAEGEIYPDLAEGWDISDDGLEYTFHLREGLKFHNGDEITAEDAAFSIQAYYADPGLPFASKFALVDDVEPVDKYTLRITLTSPNPYFLQDIATVRGSAIMPKAVVERFGDDFGSSPETTVGSGPFVLAEWTDTEMVFTAFEDWYLGRPYLDRVVNRMLADRATGALLFKAGDSDYEYLMSPAREEFMSDPQLRPLVSEATAQRGWWWGFNVTLPPFDDIRVRQAVNYAIDQAEVIEIARAGLGAPANQWLQTDLLGHDDSIQYYDRDPAKAQELLTEAGYPDGLDIDVNVWNFPESVTEAQVVASQLEEAGFRAEVVPTDFGTYMEEMDKGRYGFFISGDAQEPNTAELMRRFWHSEGERRAASFYVNPDLDALIEEAVREQDLTRRGELLVEAERILLEDAVYVPYMYPMLHIAVQPWVHGFEDIAIPAGPHSDDKVRFDQVWLDPEKRDR